jgi:hypothetical protein
MTRSLPVVRLQATALLAALTTAAGIAAQFELLSGPVVTGALRHGATAAALGAIYALTVTDVARWRRLTFPLLSALLNVLALRAALALGGYAEAMALRFDLGLLLASALFAGLYVQAAARWLAQRVSNRGTLLAMLAGATSFIALLVWRHATAAQLASALYLAGYWSCWMVLVTACHLPPGGRGR